MWRTKKQRQTSAGERLALAKEIWHWKPHSAQRRFFCSTAQVRIAACGRRWGKTEALSVDAASLALAEARAGRDCRQLVVAPTKGQARLLGNAIASRLLAAFDLKTARTAGLALDIRQKPYLQMTIYPQGADLRALAHDKTSRTARILCRSAGHVGASLRGLWAHRIIVDEAGRVPDVVMTEVLLPMLMDVGGDYVLASSPFGKRSAFYRLFAQGMGGPPDGKAGVSFQSFQCPTSDNSGNDKALLQAMREEMGDAMYAQEILAEFCDDFGAVFREEDITGCLAADDRVSAGQGELRSSPQAGRLYAVGVDWGRKVDFSVCAVLDATESPARLVSLQRWHGASWQTQVQAVADTIARFDAFRVLADGNSIGDPLAETLTDAVRQAQRDQGQRDPRGIVVERFHFGPESKLALVDHLTLGLSRRALTYPAHRALLAELRGFEYGPGGASGRARMAARGAGHDDIVMALALAWYCAPEGLPASPSSLVLLGSMLKP